MATKKAATAKRLPIDDHALLEKLQKQVAALEEKSDHNTMVVLAFFEQVEDEARKLYYASPATPHGRFARKLWGIANEAVTRMRR